MPPISPKPKHAPVQVVSSFSAALPTPHYQTLSHHLSTEPSTSTATSCAMSSPPPQKPKSAPFFTMLRTTACFAPLLLSSDTPNPLLPFKQNSENELRKALDELSNAERTHSAISALVVQNQDRRASQEKIVRSIEEKGSVAIVQTVVDDVRMAEESSGTPFTATAKEPENVVAHIDRLLEKESKEAPQMLSPELGVYLTDVLVNHMVASGDGEQGLSCPCCTRPFSLNGDVQVYEENVKQLFTRDLVEVDHDVVERHNFRKQQLQDWKKSVLDRANDLREYWRITEELETLVASSKQLCDQRTSSEEAVHGLRIDADDKKRTAATLQELADAAHRFIDASHRIARKRIDLKQKRRSLGRVVEGGRGLQIVERELNHLVDEKDQLTDKINRLNREFSKINSSIADLTNDAASAEALAKDLESKLLAETQADSERQKLLKDKEDLERREKQIGNELVVLGTKLRSKEHEQKGLRLQSGHVEQELGDSLNSLRADLQRLHELVRMIESNAVSGQDELGRLESEMSAIVEAISEKKKELKAVVPDLERARALVKDQDRRKSQLAFNIDIVKAEQEVKRIEKQIAENDALKRSIDGFATVSKVLPEVTKRKEKLVEQRAQIEGRYSEIVERIRSIKRKLTAPEYRDVHNQYRVTLIKSQTTQLAVDDLKKYQKALDQYHSTKLAEVNKIIRELWILTYKGEDISSIEIVSGQEPGSRAQKSYNYRVVYQRGGNSELDMRGRCSAGQRVLASIVIRLALAEAFGVNCGCIALDEPTVNLDEKNKKGLAVALSQIVASRSHQRNFQLILITHDEEFVSIMKTELSSLTGISMPDKYFQVCREQAADGKYYSKINALDWDDSGY